MFMNLEGERFRFVDAGGGKAHQTVKYEVIYK
jgi:hypothetical protein